MVVVLLWYGQVCSYIIKLALLHLWELNCSSLLTRSAGYGGHSIVEKPQRVAVTARWCSGHQARATTAYMNANNVNVVDFPPKSPDLIKIESILDELNCCVRRTGAIPTTLNQMRAKSINYWNNLLQDYVQRCVMSMRRRCLAVVNGAGGGHTRHYVYMDIDAAAGFDLRILYFILFWDIFDQVWSFLKYWRKCELQFYHEFEFCVRIF